MVSQTGLRVVRSNSCKRPAYMLEKGQKRGQQMLFGTKFLKFGPKRANLATLLCLQKQVAKLTSGLLYSWSLLRNNNTAINLQMFTSSYGSRRFAACDQGSHLGFFHPDLFFS